MITYLIAFAYMIIFRKNFLDLKNMAIPYSEEEEMIELARANIFSTRLLFTERTWTVVLAIQLICRSWTL